MTPEEGTQENAPPEAEATEQAGGEAPAPALNRAQRRAQAKGKGGNAAKPGFAGGPPSSLGGGAAHGPLAAKQRFQRRVGGK